jgi:hypothetical protein
LESWKDSVLSKGRPTPVHLQFGERNPIGAFGSALAVHAICVNQREIQKALRPICVAKVIDKRSSFGIRQKRGIWIPGKRDA